MLLRLINRLNKGKTADVSKIVKIDEYKIGCQKNEEGLIDLGNNSQGDPEKYRLEI